MSTPVTEFGFSYEYGVDIKTGTDAWAPIRFISAVDPQVTPITQDAATYDDKGAPNAVKSSESWTLGFTIQQHRLASGEYLPEVEALLALTKPDAVGQLATGTFRWYDKPASGTPHPDEAYEGDGTVTMARQQTGNDQIGGWTVTITGQGRRREIDNPAAA
jgi:hypothetical protein